MQMKEKIPYYIARYIDYCKEHKFTILGAFDPIGDFGEGLLPTYKGDVQKCLRWINRNSNKFASAWVNGYYELEPKYRVKVKAITVPNKYLVYGKLSGEWWIGIDSFKEVESSHTRKTLEDAGFGWVFDCDGVEITEVN